MSGATGSTRTHIYRTRTQAFQRATYHKEATVLLVVGVEHQGSEASLAIGVEDREGEGHEGRDVGAGVTVPDLNLAALELDVDVVGVVVSTHDGDDHLCGVHAVVTEALKAGAGSVRISGHRRGRHNLGTRVAHSAG